MAEGPCFPSPTLHQQATEPPGGARGGREAIVGRVSRQEMRGCTPQGPQEPNVSCSGIHSGDPSGMGVWAEEFLGEIPSSFSVGASAGKFGGHFPPAVSPPPPPTLGGATGISLPVQGCSLPAVQVQRENSQPKRAWPLGGSRPPRGLKAHKALTDQGVAREADPSVPHPLLYSGQHPGTGPLGSWGPGRTTCSLNTAGQTQSRLAAPSAVYR